MPSVLNTFSGPFSTCSILRITMGSTWWSFSTPWTGHLSAPQKLWNSQIGSTTSKYQYLTKKRLTVTITFKWSEIIPNCPRGNKSWGLTRIDVNKTDSVSKWLTGLYRRQWSAISWQCPPTLSSPTTTGPRPPGPGSGTTSKHPPWQWMWQVPGRSREY